MNKQDPLDSFVEEILDIARENSNDDARIIIRDRLLKDAVSVINAYQTEGTLTPCTA